MNERAVEIWHRPLPHWEVEEGSYFVTIHLADSLPRAAVASMDERRTLLRPVRSIDLLGSWLDRIDQYAAAGLGSCLLRSTSAVTIVRRSLQHGDGSDYVLHGSVVMPNHIHFALRVLRGRSLRAILASFKSSSAHFLNKELNRKGAVWQKEYFDVLLDDQHQLDRVLAYIADNPGKAGLSSESLVVIDQPEFIPAGQLLR